MKVNELYIIIRELRQIIVLQGSLMSVLESDEALSKQQAKLTDATSRLQEVLGRYEQYSI